MSDVFVIENLTVAYGSRIAVEDVSARFGAGRLIAVVGPNGAGKSTMLKAALGLIPRVTGWVTAFGLPLRGPDPRIGYVPQRESVDWDFPVSVLDVATMGTYARIGWLRRTPREEIACARAALERVGLADFADRQISELSGGQQQRTFLARALAQDARLYLMDEPFAGIDASSEQAILGVLRQMRDEGRTIVAVHHDLGTAAEYFDDALVLNRRVIASGEARQALSPEAIRSAYGVSLVLP